MARQNSLSPVNYLPAKATFLGAAAAIGLMVTIGCHSKSEPGGPGAVRFPGKELTEPKRDDLFRLTVPKLPTMIRQGGNTDIVIAIERGKTFDQEVALKFADLPKGVGIEPAEPLIRRGKSQVSVRVTAARESPLGTATVYVFGNPMSGPEAKNQFKIVIVKPER